MPNEGAFDNFIVIRNFSTYAFLHTEIYHMTFPLEKSPNFYTITAMFLAFVYYRALWRIWAVTFTAQPQIIWQQFLNVPCSLKLCI